MAPMIEVVMEKGKARQSAEFYMIRNVFLVSPVTLGLVPLVVMFSPEPGCHT